MRKSSKEEPKDIPALMVKEAERAVTHIKDLVESNELEPYLKGTNINGTMVDESDDITAEQVAILGGYVLAVELHNNLLKISRGETVKPRKERTVVESEIVAFDVKGGKVTKAGKLPKEVKEALKKFIKEMEEDE